MYVSGNIRGTVRPSPDGTRLKVERQGNWLAAEWPIVTSPSATQNMVRKVCDKPLSVTRVGTFPGPTKPLSVLPSTLAGVFSERIKMTGGHYLFVISGRRSAPSLACRLPASKWEAVCVPLVAATANEPISAAITAMYDELT